MRRVLHALVSVVLALFVGFSVAFVLSPDPTGVTPVLVGLVVAVFLSTLFYRHFRKRRS